MSRSHRHKRHVDCLPIEPYSANPTRRFNPCERNGRRGVAAVELAVLLPLIVLLFVIAVDAGRVFHCSLTLQNCARAGALHASDPYVVDESPFASTEEAALSDATNLSPQPTISSTTGTDDTGREYVEVTAAYSFRSITRFPGIPHLMHLSRTVRMYSSAISPDI